jgi:hypothetical protein
MTTLLLMSSAATLAVTASCKHQLAGSSLPSIRILMRKAEPTGDEPLLGAESRATTS